MSKKYEVHILEHKHPKYPTNYVVYYLDIDRQLCDTVRYCVEIEKYHLDPKMYFSWFRDNHFSIIDERTGSPLVIYTRPPVKRTEKIIRPGTQLNLF